MSRKEYGAIAAGLRSALKHLPENDNSALETWELCVRSVANSLVGSNRRFDYHRFIAACRVDTEAIA